MEALKTLVDALMAGAASYGMTTTPATVKAAYEGFKQKLLARFPAEPGVFNAVQTAKMKPTASQTREMLEEELQAAGVDRDAELVQQAQAILELLKKHGVFHPAIFQASHTGSGAATQGPGSATSSPPNNPPKA